MRTHNRFLLLGVTVFCTVAAILLFYDTFFGSHTLPNLAGQLFSAFSPILTGVFLAYLLAPMVNSFERLLFYSPVRQAKKRGQLSAPVVRAVSVFLVWAVVSVTVYLILSVLLPELYRSVMQLASNLETYFNTINEWMRLLFDRFPDVEDWLSERMQDAYNQIEMFVRGSLSQIQTLMAAAGRGMISVMNFLKNLLVGIIVSVYLMSTKEHSAAAARRVLYGLFPQEGVAWILRAVRRGDQIFSGFFRGKVLDSLIIGVLCFIGCSLFQFPYTPLVSVFVGVTNIIPFFGPFIGAIPSIFLILLVDPMKALYFAVFVLALQQLDGNVIGPKIIGDQTGLSSLWVIIAIMVGGSFFGVPGMFFGVPVCACLYSAGAFFIEQLLIKRGLPVELEAYDRGRKEMPPREKDGKRKT